MNIIDEIKSDLKTRRLYEEVTVGPHMAKQILEMNTRNRNVRPKHVDFLASQMTKGDWRFTGDPVKISRSGHVLDRQHSLLAVIESGKPQKFNIQLGLDDDAFDVIDTGRVRTARDVLATAGYKNSGYLAGAAKIVMMYIRKHLGKSKGLDPKHRPTNHELLKWVEKSANEELLTECVRDGVNYYAAFKVFAPSTYAALIYILSTKSRDMAKEFFDKFTTGENIDKESPIYVLRQKFVNLGLERKNIDQEMKYALVIKAWNLFRAGKTAKRITWGDEEDFPRAV